MNIKKEILLSLVVANFHFFLPLIGTYLGNIFVSHLNINTSFLSAIIFLYIGLQMIQEYFNDEKSYQIMNFINILIFALSVSLDSFGIGFTLGGTIFSNLLYYATFSIFSFIFTIFGFTMGKCLNKLIGNFSIFIGASIMSFLSIYNLVNFISF